MYIENKNVSPQKVSLCVRRKNRSRPILFYVESIYYIGVIEVNTFTHKKIPCVRSTIPRKNTHRGAGKIKCGEGVSIYYEKRDVITVCG